MSANLYVQGCTSETALNYNEEATEDDGSCIEDKNTGERMHRVEKKGNVHA